MILGVAGKFANCVITIVGFYCGQFAGVVMVVVVVVATEVVVASEAVVGLVAIEWVHWEPTCDLFNGTYQNCQFLKRISTWNTQQFRK